MATSINASSEKPAYVTGLEAAYGKPSQSAFGSAVFFEPHVDAAGLDEAAREKYQYFLGDSWQRGGASVWLAPWRAVYRRKSGDTHDIIAELRAVDDDEAQRSIQMILDAVAEEAKARAALAAAYDDESVMQLAAFTLGDGEAMSGILVAGRRDIGAATFLVFLLD